MKMTSSNLIITPDDHIHAMLAERREIAVIWCLEDVKEVRPDLDDDWCWEVLQNVKRHHDATIGINWDALDCTAAMMFGDAPDDGGDE